MPHLWGEQFLLFLLVFVSSVCADYYIDDTNTSLTYSSGPKAAWAPYAIGGETLELLLPNGTYQVIDAFVCWNHTYRYAACFDTDNCLLTIPFTGSGIAVYVYQAGPVGINASVTIDSSNAQTNVLSAPPAPAYETANVSMFNIQQLPSGSHTLSLLINDLSGSYSGMMFDYAYVNESLVVNPTTTSSVPASTTSTASTSVLISSTSKSHSNIGAIVGGVIGVVAVIVICSLLVLWMRRRHRHGPEMINLHSNSSPLHSSYTYDPVFPSTTSMYDPYANHNSPMNNNLTRPRGTESPSLVPLVPNRLGASDARPNPTRQDVLTPFTTTSRASNSHSSGTQNRKATSAVSQDTANTSSLQSQNGPSVSHQDLPPLLTDEQADFINTLHRNNVPAAAIARVVERMLVDRHAGIREWERETRLARSNTMTTAPPSYDLVAGRD